MGSARLMVFVGSGVLVAGVALFLLPFAGVISSLRVGVSLYLLGCFVAGIGVGVLASVSKIRELEMKLEQERSRNSQI